MKKEEEKRYLKILSYDYETEKYNIPEDIIFQSNELSIKALTLDSDSLSIAVPLAQSKTLEDYKMILNKSGSQLPENIFYQLPENFQADIDIILYYLPTNSNVQNSAFDKISPEIKDTKDFQRKIFLDYPYLYQSLDNKTLSSDDVLDIFLNYERNYLTNFGIQTSIPYDAFAHTSKSHPELFQNPSYVKSMLSILPSGRTLYYLSYVDHHFFDNLNFAQFAYSKNNASLSFFSPDIKNQIDYDIENDTFDVLISPFHLRSNKQVALKFAKSQVPINISFFSFDLQCDPDVQEAFKRNYANIPIVLDLVNELKDIKSLDDYYQFQKKHFEQTPKECEDFVSKYFLLLSKEAKSDYQFVTALPFLSHPNGRLKNWVFLSPELKQNPEIFNKMLYGNNPQEETFKIFANIALSEGDLNLVSNTELLIKKFINFRENSSKPKELLSPNSLAKVLCNPTIFEAYKDYLKENNKNHIQEHLEIVDFFTHAISFYESKLMYSSLGNNTKENTTIKRGLKF